MPTALITGAGTGIGAETAKQLALEGYEIILLGRRYEPLRQVADSIAQYGGAANIETVDVTDDEAVARVISKIPRLDIVINNAAIPGPIGSLIDADPRSWEDTLLVNVIGPFHIARAAIPILLASGGGTLINISSGAAARPILGWSSYCVSKAGLSMLTKSIWMEYGQRGLRVFGFDPGRVDTPMRETLRALDETRRYEDRSQLGKAALVAKVLAWLCRSEADNLLGQEVSFASIAAAHPSLCLE